MIVKRTRAKQKKPNRRTREAVKYEITKAQLVKIFDMWQKDHIAKLKLKYPRYAEFVSQENYGQRVAPYFLSLLKEVKGTENESCD